MCQPCKGIYNIHDRIAAHDFMEQMREFYGIAPKRPKSRNNKNVRKSVLSKIEYQLSKLTNHFVRDELRKLREAPFDKDVTPIKYNEIMSKFYRDKLESYYENIRSLA